jgi:hypothetical protein
MFFNKQINLLVRRKDMMASEINFLFYIKDAEMYLFFYDDKSFLDLAAILMRFASNPELGLDWNDITELNKKISEQMDQQKKEKI